MASSSSFVRLEVRDQIAMVELNRPERHNAIGTELAEELEATTHAVNGAKEIRVAVLTGSGPSFCSGADMKERLAGAEASAHVLEAVRRASRAVYDIDVPVVAAIRGHAVGAGLELAATCDYRIAEHSAILGLPEVNQGITSGGGLIALASLIPRGTIAKLATAEGP